MPDADDDLHATAESIKDDLDALEQIEDRKGDLRAADPEAVTLSAAAERLARRVLRQASAQRELTEEAAEPDPGAA
jgi:hypothetical protein